MVSYLYFIYDRKKKKKLLDIHLECYFVVQPSSEPGWLVGTLNGKTGLIPKNYVEQLP